MKETKIKLFLYFALLLVLMTNSCGYKDFSRSEYLEFVRSESSGLKVIKEFNNVVFELQYLPSEFIVLNRQELNKINLAEYKRNINEANSSFYFLLIIRDKNSNGSVINLIHNKEQYSKTQMYINSDMQGDFTIKANSTQSACALLHFENPEKIRKELRFNLMFEKKAPLTEDIIISYDDNLFNNGKINFKIDIDDINGVPSVKI